MDNPTFNAKAAAKLAAKLRTKIVADLTGKPAPKTTRAPRKKKDTAKK